MFIKTANGKEYAISTNQLDLYMAGKFKLEYTDDKGKKQTPAIIHRAPLGSHERFIAFLIEFNNDYAIRTYFEYNEWFFFTGFPAHFPFFGA